MLHLDKQRATDDPLGVSYFSVIAIALNTGGAVLRSGLRKDDRRSRRLLWPERESRRAHHALALGSI
jgi:hypothetical protein